MAEEIKNEAVEAIEEPKPKAKRTRRKKAVEPVVETVSAIPEVGVVKTTSEEPAIKSKAVSKPKANKYTGKVIASLLNVREKPEMNAAVLYAVNYNDKLVIVDENNGWGKLENGGFVMLKFIKKVDD